MMRARRSLTFLATAFLAALPVAAADIQIVAVQYPERSTVKLQLVSTSRVAPAQAKAAVRFKDGQAHIEIDYVNLPPAVLFSGDVTSYVVWAVARDGAAENLGELIVHDPSGDAEYRTGQKEFALLVTAEPFPLVLKPSDLAVFSSVAPPAKKAKSTMVTLSSLAPGARRGNEQVGGMRYAGSEPIDLVQAQSVLAQAQQMGADRYNADAVRDAGITLAQATNSYKAGRTRVGTDYARRSLSLSSTAIRDTQRRLAEQAAAAAAARRAAEMASLEDQRLTAQRQAAASDRQAAASDRQALSAREQAITAREQTAAAQAQLAQSQQQLADAQRQAAAAQQQMSSLERQAEQAEADAAAAQERAAAAGLSAEAADAARREADESRRRAEALAAQAESARSEAERTTADVAAVAATLESQKQELQSRTRALQSQTQDLQEQKQQLETRVGESEAELARLRKQRDDLAGQLDNALSSVAQITKTARGVVVSLPDILFDTNKATLKQNAQVAMGKLAGIVSVFPNINLRIEGHTDSTGTDAINDRLSRERANAVMTFLRGQGVAEQRLTSEGYGSKIPVADNGTVDGRARNRRVEIILAEGVIQGAD